MKTLFEELKKSKCVCVPFSKVYDFVAYCNKRGVIVYGGAFFHELGQFFYTDFNDANGAI